MNFQNLAIIFVISTQVYSCRSAEFQTNSIQSEFSDVLDPGTCHTRGVGLAGLKKKVDWDRVKDLSRQCKLAAKASNFGPVKSTAFLCGCLAISADADKFARTQSKKNEVYSKTDSSECLRHVTWQFQMSCIYGAGPAKALGDIREAEAIADKRNQDDVDRDLAHNRLGRIMSTVFSQKNQNLSLGSCRKASHAASLEAQQKQICVRLKPERFFPSLEQINEVAHEFRL